MKSTWINGVQYYEGQRGISLPAVKTILTKTQTEDSKLALDNWRRRVGQVEAERICRTRKEEGIALHKMVEAYLRGQPFGTCSQSIQPFWDSIQPVLEHIDHVTLLETLVCNYTERYAGRVDLVACYRDIPCVIEWKTADKPKNWLKGLYDIPLQLVAYGGAINRSYRNSLYGEKISHALVIIALPNVPAEIFLLDRDLTICYWKKWQERLRLFYRGAPHENIAV